MPYHSYHLTKYYTFELFDEAGINQAVFTRQGGVSAEPWSSLNLGGTVGDAPENVAENRRRCFEAFGRPIDTSFDVWQVHSTVVVCTDAPRPPQNSHQRADAILTDRQDVTLFMRFADCVPILLADPIRKVVGIVHAGWMGTVNRIAESTISAMKDRYGSDPADILAGIGPAVCLDHYPVGEDVVVKVKAAFGSDATQLLIQYPKQTHFDLWGANRLILEQSGVKQIELSGLCTAHSIEDWYSHRAEHGKTGRFGALIALKGGKA